MNYLYDIVQKLASNDVKFIIAGGVAVVLHGVERVTMDLDISVQMQEGNVRRFLSIMKELDMTPRVPVPAEVLLDHDAMQMIVNEKGAIVFTFLDIDNPFKHVDVFLRDELSYESLLYDTVVVEVAGNDVRMLSRDKLIALKKEVRPVRDKDLFDIKALENLT